VILIEDDARARASLAAELRDEGLEVAAFASAEDASSELRPESRVDVLLADVRLPGASGIELVRRLAGEKRLPPTVVISGEATIGEAVEALRLGVYDFVEKPFSRERLVTSIRNALAHAALEGELHALRTALGEGELIGESEVMAALRQRIAAAAETDATVLVRGESGTGKELVAAALHRASRRKAGPLVRVNCSAISPSLVEDELFGHVRGAFTDARAARPGLFEEASGGTLLLDEIGDMEPALQARLLRVLEDGRVRRLGDAREVAVDVRVIAATHRDLEAATASGSFRQDLYFRLARLPLDVPPLRERPGDVRLLALRFLEAACRQHRLRPKSLEPSALERLERHAWPGNVRELKHACERAVVFGGDPITGSDFGLPEDSVGALLLPEGLLRSGAVPAIGLKEFRARCESEYIQHVLQREGWNLAAAARALGLRRTYLHAKLAALGIVRPKGAEAREPSAARRRLGAPRSPARR
jgi:two-component system nitrogen regulation response regulator NtrX